jgi:hypothetical protein
MGIVSRPKGIHGLSPNILPKTFDEYPYNMLILSEI